MGERQKHREAEKTKHWAHRSTKSERKTAGRYSTLTHIRLGHTTVCGQKADWRPCQEDKWKRSGGRSVHVCVFVWTCVWWVKGTAGSLYLSAFGSLAALQSWASPGKLEIPPKELWGSVWIAEWSHLLSFCLRCFSWMGQPGVKAPKTWLKMVKNTVNQTNIYQASLPGAT